MQYEDKEMICIVLLLVLSPLCLATGFVPVVLWTNIRSEKCMPSVPIYPGESISILTESPYFDCLQSSHPDIIKVYVTSELDLHDLGVTHDAAGKVKAFHHLQGAVATHPSLVMPAVKSTSVPASLEIVFRNSFKQSTVSVVDVGTIDRDSLASTRRSIALIDETISADQLKIKPNEKFIAVLVALSPPQAFFAPEESHHGRQLLAVTEPFSPSSQQLVNYQTCIFLTYSNVTLTYQKKVMNLTSPTVQNGSCNTSSDSANINMTFAWVNGSTSKMDIKLGLSFVRVKSKASGYTWWNITSAILSHSISGKEVPYEMKITDDYSYTSPDGWSWVCEKPIPLSWKEHTDASNPIIQKLQFENFQLQPFSIKNGTFSRAVDCSGWITGPIWMATVVSILILLIFTFGLLFMCSVTTMDRFDDPRSKGISINTPENN